MKNTNLKLLDEFFKKADDGVLIADAKTRKFIYANKKISSMLGYTRDELLKLGVNDIHRKKDLSRVIEKFSSAVSEKENIAKNLPVQRKNGEIIYCDISEMKTQIGDKDYLIGVFRVVRRKGEKLSGKENADKFINEMTSSFVFFDLKGEIILINEAGARNLGGDVSDFIGKSFYDFVPEIRKFIAKRKNSIIKKGKEESFEHEMFMPTGEIKNLWTTIKPFKNKNGKIFAFEVVSYDFIEYEAFTKIKRGKELLGSPFFEGSVVPIVMIDKNHKVTHWNSALEKVSGCKAKEMIGTRNQWQPFYKNKRPILADLVLDKKDISEIEKWYSKEEKVFVKESEFSNGVFQGTNFFPDMGDNGKWLFFTSSLIKDKKGEVIGAMEIIEDITEIKINEKELRENAEKYAVIMNKTGQIIYDYNIGTGQIKWLGAFEEVLGYPNEEMQKIDVKKWGQMVYVDDRKKALKDLKIAEKKGGLYFANYRFLKKDGDYVYISERGVCLRDKEENVFKMVGVMEDVTQERLAENKIIKNEKRLRDLYENIPGAVYRCKNNKDRKVIFVSDFIEKISGLKVETLIEHNDSFIDLTYEEDRAKVRKRIKEAAVSGKNFDLQYRIITKNKEIKWVHERGKVVETKKGRGGYIDGVILDVTAEIETEEALKREKEMMQRYLGVIGVMVIVLNKKGEVVLINKLGEEILGYSKEEIIGKDWFSNFLPKNEFREVKKVFRGIFKKTSVLPSLYENKVVNRSGEERIISWRNSFIKNDEGEIVSIVSSGEDVTEKRKIERELADSEKKYRTLVEFASDTVLYIDTNGKIIEVNRAMEKIVGYTRKEVAGKYIYELNELIPLESMRTIMEKFKSRLLGKKLKPYVVSLISKKGEEKLFEITASVIKEGKKSLGVFALLHDVTEREKSRVILKESEEKFRVLFEAASDAIFMIKDDKFVDCNKRTLKLFACKREEIIGHTPADFSPEYQPDGKLTSQKAKEEVFKALNEGPRHFEWKHIRKGDELFDVDVNLNRVNIGGEDYVQAVVRDITKRKRAEEALKSSEEKLRAVVENIGDGVFVLNCERKVLMFNHQASVISGFNRQEIIGKRYDTKLRFVLEGSEEVKKDFIEQCIKKGDMIETRNHTQLIRKDGTRVVISYSSSPLRNKEDRIVGCVVVFRDVSREREIDKMKSEFISVASHQLKTPLSGVKWFTELLLRGKVGELNDKQKDFIEQIRVSNERLISLVSDLLNVSHIETGRKFDVVKGKVNACRVVEKVLELNKPIMERLKVEVVREGQCDKTFNILADEEKIQQVFFNLITNAIKYSRANSKVFLNAEFKNGEVIFSVKDSGLGIASKDFPRVFTKFYRGDNAIKTETDGTGLGLYIAKAIVEAHGGEIWFESKLGEGSTFYFSIKKYK